MRLKSSLSLEKPTGWGETVKSIWWWHDMMVIILEMLSIKVKYSCRRCSSCRSISQQRDDESELSWVIQILTEKLQFLFNFARSPLHEINTRDFISSVYYFSTSTSSSCGPPKRQHRRDAECGGNEISFDDFSSGTSLTKLTEEWKKVSYVNIIMKFSDFPI